MAACCASQAFGTGLRMATLHASPCICRRQHAFMHNNCLLLAATLHKAVHQGLYNDMFSYLFKAYSNATTSASLLVCIYVATAVACHLDTLPFSFRRCGEAHTQLDRKTVTCFSARTYSKPHNRTGKVFDRRRGAQPGLGICVGARHAAAQPPAAAPLPHAPALPRAPCRCVQHSAVPCLHNGRLQ